MKKIIAYMICIIMIASNVTIYAENGFYDTFPDDMYYVETEYASTDFEEASINSGSAYKYINHKGSNLSVNGKQMELRSFAEPTISESDSALADNGHGKCLILDAVSGAYIRSESGAINSGILVYEMDYAKDKTDVSSTPFDGYFTNIKGNTNQHAGNVVFDATGNITAFGTTYSEYEAKRWYNIRYVIDCTNKNATVYIDDVFAASKSIDTNGGFKEWFRTSIGVNSGVVQYIDNLKIYTLKEAEPEFTVIPYATEVIGGMNFGGQFSVLHYPGADTVEFNVSDGGDEWETMASNTIDNREFSFKVHSDFFFKAVLKDSDGNTLEESDITEVNVKSTYGDVEKWNIDFEHHELVGNNEKYVFSEGTKLQNGDDSLHSNRNSETADVLIDKNETSPEMGKSMKLYTTNPSDNMQLNEYQASLAGPVVVAEYDVCFESEDVNATCMLWHYFVGSSTKTGATLSASNGSFRFNGNTYDFDANKWYNLKMYVDISSGRTSCYIDDNCIGVYESDLTGFTKTKKLYTNLTNCENGVMWIDNYKVYETAFVPEITDVYSEDNIITVEFSEAVREFESTDFFSAKYNENILTPKSWSFDGQSKNKINIECEEEIYTSVPIDISILLGEDTLNCTYTAPASEFDITDVTFSKTSDGIRAEAKLCGATDKSLIMLLVSYNDKGEIISVIADEKLIDENISVLTCTSENAKICKVFFIDSWQNAFASKNVVYTYGG